MKAASVPIVLIVVIFLPCRVAVINAAPAAIVANMKALPGTGALAKSPFGCPPEILNVEPEDQPLKFLI